MKKIQKFTAIIFLICGLLFAQQGFAGTNPPDPPGSHGQTDDQAGGGAPIGGGLFILLGLGAAYGGKKLYDHNKKAEEIQ